MPRFDPFALTPAASLNQTRLADAAFIDAELRAVPGYDMLSAAALRRQIAAEAKALHLESALALSADLLPNLDACLAASDNAVRAAALDLAQRFGRCVAFLVLTLVTPAAASGLSDDAAAYRAHWTTIRHVYLGGGVVSGRLGIAMRDAAIETLGAARRADVRLDVAPNAAVLPLIGAARSLQTVAEAALVADFGGTNARLGYATYGDGALTSLRLEPPVAVPQPGTGVTGADGVGAFITDTLAMAWSRGRQEGFQLAPEIAVSLAAYVHDGHPIDYGSEPGYYALHHLGANASEALSQRLSGAVGQTVRVTLSHDGTTAARAFAGARDAALIMLGTALGVGFVPPERDLRPVAPGFRVDMV
jgi:hypothetical protein